MTPVVAMPESVQFWPIADLVPYAQNAKHHSVDQVTRIAASMAEFGWTVPCLVAADGELIAGHGRVLAATQLGIETAPVIVLAHRSDAQLRELRILEERLANLPDWDWDEFRNQDFSWESFSAPIRQRWHKQKSNK